MKIECLAVTHEDNNINDKEMYIFGGKVAGICYMQEDYFENKFGNDEQAEKRAKFVANTGHHSVFDHSFVTLRLSGVPKIVAMLLNSTEYYTTSEKSARYTFMQPESQLESTLYEKWTLRFKELIVKQYPQIDEKSVEKLAIENARYMLSVYTPTTMAWTVSFRQLAYTVKWLEHFALGNSPQKIKDSVKELSKLIKELTNCNSLIVENKGREFEFFRNDGELNNVEFIGDIYQTTYLSTYAQLAQAQRHRTLHYEIETGDFGYYVPQLISHFGLTDEWISDISSLEEFVPQGKLVKVLEQGRATKFFDKCKERLCGRAQLEIALQTAVILEKFIANKRNLSETSKQALYKVSTDSKVHCKCQMEGIECKEVCMWGGKYGLNRLI